MPKHSLVIVDMIEAYLTPGQKLYCDAAPKIVPAINLLASEMRKKEALIVFANTTLTSPDDPIARKWGMHAIAGTSGPNVWNGIERDTGDVIVPKTSYNSFFRTSLHELLSSKNVETVAIAGIHTHVCVLLTAAAASDYGYDVTAFEDGMTTSYRPNHETRLRFFSTHIGTLTTVSEYVSTL